MKPDQMVLDPKQDPPAEQPEQTAAPSPELRFEFSPSIGKLIEALAKASKSFKPIIKSEVNPFFKSKYADLANVIEATRDSLSDNGLAVLQPPAFDRLTGTVEIVTFLAHSSGEWIKAVLHMPTSKGDAQGVGSAITYGRRYAYSAVLNVASEQDDDANAAVSKDFKKKEETEEEFDQRTADQQCIAIFQQNAIIEACKKSGKSEEEVSAYLGLIGHKRIEHLLKSEFQDFLKWANSKTEAKPKLPAGLKVASQIESPTQKAMKRLFAFANEHKIPEVDVKRAAYEKFSVDSMTKLTIIQLDEMVNWVKEVVKTTQES